MPPPMRCTGSATQISMAKHKNIPIFIPHSGCPHQCVFCNQKTISGSVGYDLSILREQIETVLSCAKSDDEIEIAFFGGSFTGIPRDEMITLLALANEYLCDNRICGIRLSTRPDYISNEILDILAQYGVTDIELGVQSLSDKVLLASERGHTSKQTENACRLILQHGKFSLVGQMMLGLPFSAREDEIQTAKGLFDLGVHAIRIYPTVVLQNTPLAQALSLGDYTPLSLTEAVNTAADILELADARNIPCLRIGLCENEALHGGGGMVAGPFHPAFGELAVSEVFFRRTVKALQSIDCRGKEIRLLIPKGALSKAIGQKRNNISRLYELLSPKKIRFIESADLKGYEVCPQEDHCIASYIT